MSPGSGTAQIPDCATRSPPGLDHRDATRCRPDRTPNGRRAPWSCHVLQVAVAVAYRGRPVGRYTWIVTPFGVARDSTRSSAASGPVSGNSRVPWPMTAGQTNRVISSTSWLSNSQRIRAPLPWTCSSPSRLAFSSPIAPATSPWRTVVFDNRGSVSVVDATYLGCVFKSAAMGLAPIIRAVCQGLLHGLDTGEDALDRH